MNINTLILNNCIFIGFEKKDGMIAFYFYVVLTLWMFLVFYFIRFNLQILENLPSINRSEYILIILLIDIPSYIAMFLVLKVRNQKINSIGFSYKGWKSSFLIGILTITILLIKKTDPIKILYFYLAIGFYEEILFRGFFWPRLVSLLGKNKGTILCGIMFGIIHTPFLIVLKGENPFRATINNIGNGLIGHLIFGFIYTKSKNIMLPSFIHGFLDSLGT